MELGLSGRDASFKICFCQAKDVKVMLNCKVTKGCILEMGRELWETTEVLGSDSQRAFQLWARRDTPCIVGWLCADSVIVVGSGLRTGLPEEDVGSQNI
jgi:hypothetical protein